MKKSKKETVLGASLLTPLLLAMNPVSINAEQLSYDHEAQMNVNAEGVYANTLSSTTFNGTQTFDYEGKPFDSDNDTDADPYG